MFGRERKDGREVNLNEKTDNFLYSGFFMAISLLLITIKNVHYVLICVGKYPICIKCPPFLTFDLYSTKRVNYKVSSTAKNYAFLLSPNNPTDAGNSEENFSCNNKTNYT